VVSYVLGFSPQNLKLNGSFTLESQSVRKQKFSVQAAAAFYAPRVQKAPKKPPSRNSGAVFSQEEIRDLSVDLQTRFP